MRIVNKSITYTKSKYKIIPSTSNKTFLQTWYIIIHFKFGEWKEVIIMIMTVWFDLLGFHSY